MNLLDQDGKPVLWTVTVSFTELVQERHVVGRRGQDGDEVVESGQIQLANGARVSLLDQEAAAALGTQASDDFELGLAKSEPFDVVLPHCFGVGKEDLGCALLDHRSTDWVGEHVGRTLRVEDAQAVLLTDRLLLDARKPGARPDVEAIVAALGALVAPPAAETGPVRPRRRERA